MRRDVGVRDEVRFSMLSGYMPVDLVSIDCTSVHARKQTHLGTRILQAGRQPISAAP